MRVIGITGPVGHGKTTLAKAFASQVPRSATMDFSDVVARIATLWLDAGTMDGVRSDVAANSDLVGWLEMLPAVMRTVLPQLSDEPSVPLDEVTRSSELASLRRVVSLVQADASDGLRGPVTRTNKERYRPLLQWLGASCIRWYGTTVWSDEVRRRIAALTSAGRQMFVVSGIRYPHDAEMIRHSGGTVIEIFREGLPLPYSDDETERSRSRVVADARIVGTRDTRPEELDGVARRVLADLDAGGLRHEYVV